jgi:hypothetical protein
LILPVPLRGHVIVWMLTLLSLFGMGISLYIQKQAAGQNGSGTQGLRFILLAGIVLVGLISAYLGVWLLGVLTMALALLVSVISITHSVRI